MSDIISDIYSALTTLKIEVQIGDFQTTSALPDIYAVIVPLSEDYETADDEPDFDVQQASAELYTKGMWRTAVNNICGECIKRGLSVNARRYIGRNEETGYFQYSITFEEAYDCES